MNCSLQKLGCAILILFCACGGGIAPEDAGESHLKPALDSLSADDLMARTRFLSADDLEGRAPGTRGEDLTVAYLTEQFGLFGLQPGNPDGTFVQTSPLVGITSKSKSVVQAGQTSIEWTPLQDYVAISRRFVTEIKVENSPVVFVGYGVVAPEFGWDDYKDVDVAGKTIVMLVNDPAVPDPNDPAKLDDSMFKGRAMTYYGRWPYKYEIATQKGAAAAIIVHETGPAGYPWEVVSGSWGRENFDIDRPDGNRDRVSVEAWIQLEKARELFSAVGEDFDALKKNALSRDFRPVELDARASFEIQNELRNVQSRNVAAKLEGSDPQLKNEYVVYSAHWDHLGKDERLEGDQIFNGALDNASGTAGLLELAEAFSKLNPRPSRSILFLAVTAEEKGLLGAKYYASNPLYPLQDTLANINMDGINQWGRTRDIVIVGYGNSTLDDLLEQAAAGQGREIKPDAEPEKGYFYRSDHFEFAKKGVPALYTDSGIDFIDKPAGFGQNKRDEYVANDYHKVSDEIKPDWDLSGAVEDLELLFKVGYQVAEGTTWPEWKAGTEFKALREEMLRKRATVQ